ncbi:MAG: J domain-containing protein [Acidimicrobiales bacterium]
MDLDSAYLVLQIAIGVDWEEITSAHRRLAKLYHPDRLVTYSVDAQAMGRERMAQINAAHATLRALHFKR